MADDVEDVEVTITLDLGELILLVNCASLGAAVAMHPMSDLVVEHSIKTRQVLDDVGSAYWNTMIFALEKAIADAVPAEQRLTAYAGFLNSPTREGNN